MDDGATGERPPEVGTRHGLFGAAAIGAGIVTLVFATLGDGVDVPADGVRRIVVEYGHTAVWALLTAALATAAVTGRWERASGALATGALVLYLVFLGAVLVSG